MPYPDSFAWYYADDLDVPFKPATNESAPDLTGSSLSFAIAKRLGDTALVTKTTAGGTITVTSAPDGLFTVHLLAADAASLGGLGLFRFQVKTVSPTTTLAEGWVNVHDTIR